MKNNLKERFMLKSFSIDNNKDMGIGSIKNEIGKILSRVRKIKIGLLNYKRLRF
jgi:hypothetical protein